MLAARDAIAVTPDDAWVPTYTLRRFPRGGGEPTVTSGPLASCARTYRPRAFAGWSITTVLSLPVGEAGAVGDFGAGEAVPGGVAVVSGPGHVYASTNSVYVTTTELDHRAGDLTTDVHAFSTTGPSAVYVASTALTGRLLNQWALYERAGVLFAATTSSPSSVTASSSTLTALEVRGRALATVGTVPRIGVGEAITAVRYVGALAFVVTFREVDPLYAIDLRVPSRMVTLGALKVPGFSRYLHPLAPGLLLGLGVSVGAPGEWRRFAKASLFRVPSAATDGGAGRLTELATWTPPPIARRPAASGSAWQADNDHRAFLYLPARRLIVAPLDVYDDKGGRTEVTLLRVAPGGEPSPSLPASRTGGGLGARAHHPRGGDGRALLVDGRAGGGGGARLGHLARHVSGGAVGPVRGRGGGGGGGSREVVAAAGDSGAGGNGAPSGGREQQTVDLDTKRTQYAHARTAPLRPQGETLPGGEEPHCQPPCCAVLL
ncbi:hypothetical protein BU14_0126s0011 [Porphyra umbilicalis]|uniref:Uncharacterized protein n=1 Tax=Porphyra umbilicalis TaxID=2786 RepID=A0A1X6PAS2_PORUM|nr:hypothetical protein BU14_0126s0011 [Porphyra umbilicalis]|eukprot:OSX77972.1 hypothetical protein BU14_0126s0011 [Porphyra umbilicalis]